MKKTIAITLSAAALIGALITSTQFKAQADQPARNRHEAIVIGYHATYREVTDENGWTYRTEDDFVIDLVSGSAGAPDVKLGKRLGDTIAFLNNEGYKFRRSLAFSLDIYER